MTLKAELLILVVVVCAFLLTGCELLQGGKTTGPQIDPRAKLSAKQQEAKLLAQIDEKFENPDAHFHLGQFYHAAKRWDDAEYHYNIALSFDPVHWSAQAAKVKLQQDKGEPGQARLAAEIYMNQTATSVDKLLDLGQAFQEQRLGEYALACYERARRLEPNSARVYKHMGDYYLSKNNKARAEEYYRRSFNLDPLQPDVAYELGLLGVPIEVKPRPQERGEKSETSTPQPGEKTEP